MRPDSFGRRLNSWDKFRVCTTGPCSPHEAIFGWAGGQMASLYTRSANRRALSAGAMNKLSRTETETSIPAPDYKVRTPAKNLTISELIFWAGALGGTRTPTILLTATSRQRV